MEKLRVQQVILVEGRYDATALASVVDALILTTDGFGIFSDKEKKQLIQKLGKQRGIIILTDSDAAGFRIRHYVEKLAEGAEVKHAYIPEVVGKEPRKAAPSKEGTIGVEGMPPEVLLQALQRAGVGTLPPKTGQEISYTDLFEMGLSGTVQSAEKRRSLLLRLGLPARLSKRALQQVLSSLYTKEEIWQIVKEQKPVLFWDFHGTLSLPDVTWFDAAMEAAAETVPQKPLSLEVLIKHFGGTCLPWWSVPSRDTRHLTPPGAWWAHCETEFTAMFQKCGFTQEEAAAIAPKLREKVLEPERYKLYPDALSTLAQLRERGYRHYLLSNNYPELETLANVLGLSHLLDAVVVSALVGYDKPRLEIFAYARQLAGSPAACWMIGDNPEDDITGGKQAGFTTVHVHQKQQETKDADYTVDELAELLVLLP